MGVIKYTPQLHDNFMKFIISTTKSHYELWPLYGCFVIWGGFFTAAAIWNGSKQDIWINRSNRTPPWEWSRIKEQYGRKQKMIDIHNWPVVKEVATLQDQMIKAANERRH